MVAAALCGALGLAGFFTGITSVSLALFVAAYVAGGWFTVHEVWERLQKGALDVHFLMLAVAAGSASIGAWSEGAMLLFLFSLSGALEHYAMGRTSREIRSLFKSAPKEAVVLDAQGHETRVPVEQLEAGMKLLIKPGDQFPVDAEVIKGATASDESNLTGEATPVEKNIGDTVLAGTQNLWGAVEASVLRRASQSALQRIIKLIREAQHLKAPSQRFTDKFGTSYTYGILALTTLMFFVWCAGGGQGAICVHRGPEERFLPGHDVARCRVTLCAGSFNSFRGAWLPSPGAAKRGILFRGGAAVENLAEVTVVAMDKTGTLTTGELRVETIESFPPGQGSGSSPPGLLARTSINSSAGPGHNPLRQTAAVAPRGTWPVGIDSPVPAFRPGSARRRFGLGSGLGLPTDHTTQPSPPRPRRKQVFLRSG